VKLSGVVPSVMVLKLTVELEKSEASVFSVHPPVLPVMVLAACVPVWLARFRSVASALLAVAPDAMPSSLALSVPLIAPEAPPETTAGRRAAATVPVRLAASVPVANAPRPDTSVAAIARKVLAWAAVRSATLPAAVAPRSVAPVAAASIARVTLFAPMLSATAPDELVTSPVKAGMRAARSVPAPRSAALPLVATAASVGRPLRSL
jgi:hypothetical protein